MSHRNGTHQEPGSLPGVLPPLTNAQNAALTFAKSLEDLEVAKDRSDKRKDEMLKAAAIEKVDTIHVCDAQNFKHTFIIDQSTKTTIKRSKALNVLADAGYEPAQRLGFF